MGTKSKGRLRLRYINQVIEDTECKNYRELKNIANERIEWKAAANQSS